MNNETFGITFQYAICSYFKIDSDISMNRVNQDLLHSFSDSKILSKIFKSNSKPIEYLTSSKKFTSTYIKRCPHNFLLENGESFSVRTFKGQGKMFAPKVVGQAGEDTFNHFFGHLHSEKINRSNFKKFCLNQIHNILPIVVDYALVSDHNCWIYKQDDNFKYKIINRDDLPDLTFNSSDFSFSRPTAQIWNESNTIKYKGQTILEIQLHNNRSGFKIRLHRENFPDLLNREKKLNNSMLGDTAELAICNVFDLDLGNESKRLVHNSDRNILSSFVRHYFDNKYDLFPLNPIKYSGTEKRERGSHSKSGVDFYLEKDNTLSLKTNKSKSYKVCPPEIGQPSPKTFDLYFAEKGLYEGEVNEAKFRKLVKNSRTVCLLLSEYIKFLNECDFLLWTRYLDENKISSTLIRKNELENIKFKPEHISYTNDFTNKSSVTIKYGIHNKISLGEFQIHSARNSLKFRFNFGNLLSLR
tara:strand:+ start:1532 stop:2944 length:1413 start_codon:yes stop_codon:yes gene_type:complete